MKIRYLIVVAMLMIANMCNAAADMKPHPFDPCVSFPLGNFNGSQPYGNVWHSWCSSHIGAQGQVYSALPVNSHSADWLNTIFSVAPLGQDAGRFHINLGTTLGHYINSTGTAWQTMTWVGGGRDAATYYGLYPYTAGVTVLQQGDPDHHCLIVDTIGCYLYELYYASVGSDSLNNTARDGVRWDLNSNALLPNGCSSADEAGLPIASGVFTYQEVMIDHQVSHPLRFQSYGVNIDKTANSWLWPARHTSAGGGGYTIKSIPVPFGARLRLKGTFVPTGGAATDPGFLALTDAMQKHGAFLADRGSSQIALSGCEDSRWGTWPSNFMTWSAQWIPYLEFVDNAGHIVDIDSGEFIP